MICSSAYEGVMTKKVAVIGAGFAGLALSWYLRHLDVHVDLYDAKEVGAGASGVASGLVHPYPGEKARRSMYAADALQETKKLLSVAQNFVQEPVANYCGILRQVSAELLPCFQRHSIEYRDVQFMQENLFCIVSGIVVYAKQYMRGLFLACKKLGVTWHQHNIESLQPLEGYHATIFAIGAGIFAFPEAKTLSLYPVKGQTLLCQAPQRMERPILGKGHIIPHESSLVHIGATYEREVLDETPNIQMARKDLFVKAHGLMPHWDDLEVYDCFAGIRVTSLKHYTPTCCKIRERLFVMTSLGSRGLLYHAYFAKQLALSIA